MNAVKLDVNNIQPLFLSNPAPPESQPVCFPGGYIDFLHDEIVYDDGQHMELSGREMALLRYMTENPGRILTREELLVHVWEMNSPYIVTRTIDMHVAKLRDKLHDDPQHPRILLTIRGQGYVFMPIPKEQECAGEASEEAKLAPAMAVCC